MFKMNVFIQPNMGAGVAAFTMRMSIIDGDTFTLPGIYEVTRYRSEEGSRFQYICN